MNAVTFSFELETAFDVSLGETTFNGQQTLAEVRRDPARARSHVDMTVARSPELELRALIAELTRARPESIDLASPMDRQGLDSLQLIILRERLESSLAVVFSDEEWMALDTPASVLARVSSQMGGTRDSSLR